MRKTKLATALFLASFFATPALAGGHIGLASYATNLSIDIPGSTSLKFAGPALNLGAEFNDYVSIDANLYSLTEDTNSDFTSKGYDASLRLGPVGDGFNFFLALGMFSETWDDTVDTMDFSGAQAGLGLGYNWESAGLALTSSVRDVKDYEDKLGVSGTGFTLTAASAAISFYFRF